jgi:hypothetical protein
MNQPVALGEKRTCNGRTVFQDKVKVNKVFTGTFSAGLT